MTPLRQCNGCGGLTRSRYCARCAARKKAVYKPMSSRDRNLGGRWRRIRHAHILAHPYCLRCANLGVTTFGTESRPLEVHHRVPRRVFAELYPSADPHAAANLCSLCWLCHRLITSIEGTLGYEAANEEIERPTPRSKFENLAASIKERNSTMGYKPCPNCDCSVVQIRLDEPNTRVDPDILREALAERTEDGELRFSLGEARKKAERFDVKENVARQAFVEFENGCVYSLEQNVTGDSAEWSPQWKLRDRLRDCPKRDELAGPPQGVGFRS